jgi:hypothetical protein
MSKIKDTNQIESDWIGTCQQLIEDEANKALWAEYKIFGSYVFDHLDRYNKTRSGIARLLRMARAYTSLQAQFPQHRLPPISGLAPGVKAMALNDVSRLLRVLNHSDKEQIAQLIATGDLGSTHTKHLLRLYDHAMKRNSTRGRPTLDSLPTTADSTPDLLVHCIEQLSLDSRFGELIDKAQMVNLGPSAHWNLVFSSNSVPRVVWVAPPKTKLEQPVLISLYLLTEPIPLTWISSANLDLYDQSFIVTGPKAEILNRSVRIFAELCALDEVNEGPFLVLVYKGKESREADRKVLKLLLKSALAL